MYTCHSIFAQINSVILLIDSKGGEGERERLICHLLSNHSNEICYYLQFYCLLLLPY